MTVSIGPLLKKSVKKDALNKTCHNWWENHCNSVKKTARHACEPGVVNFSADWFVQGHTVHSKLSFNERSYVN
jgi:hypothetical protein